MADKPVVGPKGKETAVYGDYSQEASLLASLVVEVFAEESSPKPILNPKLIVKVNPETLTDESARAIFLRAHSLAADKGAVYFANLLQKDEKATAFSGSGIKLISDLDEDWETDTLRTGCLGYVTVNLPRIVHECEKDKIKFFDILKERCELAIRALGIKHRALKQYGKTALPFLMQSTNGDTYFRLENCSGIVKPGRTRRSRRNLHGQTQIILKAPNSLEIVQNTQAYVNKMGRKYGKRLFPAIMRSPEASSRLAQLDVEKYGVAKVKFMGTRDKPFYTTTRMHLQTGNFLSVPSEQLDAQRRLKG